MEIQTGPVRRKARDVVLLDGKAFQHVITSISRGRLGSLINELAPLRLVVARPKDAFDDVKDASYFVIDDKALRIRLARPSYLILDVSPGMMPSVVPHSVELYERARGKIESVLLNIQAFPTHSSGFFEELLPEGSLDSVTLGILLGYPIVYWSRDGSNNCLANEPLVLVSIFEAPGCEHPLTSFSVPKMLMEDIDVRRVMEQWKKDMKAKGLVVSDREVVLDAVSL
jgi:hypothetical protein